MNGLMIILASSTGQLTQAVQMDPGRVSVEKKGDATLFKYEGAFPGRDIGEPALPVLEKFFLLPPGATVDSVVVDEIKGFVLATGVQVATLQWPRLPELPVPDSVAPRIKNGKFPEAPAELGYLGDMRGARIAVLRLFPLGYDLDKGEVWFNQTFRLRIFYTDGSGETGWVTGPWAEFINDLVENPGLPPSPNWGTDYIIITSEALAGSFGRLLEWKTKKGMNGKIFTVEWITSVYPGVDRQERIRNFIKDAYERLGVSFVLLGGNQYVVPMRMAYQPMGYPQYGDSVPTDLYYACLDGDWNPDGDHHWGEWPDTVDFLPDVFVARVPVSQVSEAEAYIDKLIRYETEGPTCPTRAVVHASDLFSAGDGAYYGRRVARHFPGDFRLDSLYEATIGHDITSKEILDTLNQGPGYLFMIGHGNWWRVQLDRSTGANLDLENARSLVNPTGFFNMIVSCHGNSVYESSVGKAMFLDPHGGSIASLGSGKLDFADYGILVAESVLVNIFRDGLFYAGQADLTARATWVGMATTSPLARHLLMAYNLMGDPSTELWTGTPGVLDVLHDSIADVSFSVQVSQKGIPVKGAMVTITGPETHIVELTDVRGRAIFENLGISSDSINLTVAKHNFMPFLARVPVRRYGAIVEAELSPWPSGTVPQAGDTFLIRVSLKNTGARATGPLTCKITGDTSVFIWSSMNDASSSKDGHTCSFSLPDLPAGAKREVFFHAATSPGIPPVAYLSFSLMSQWAQGYSRDSFWVMAQGPCVELVGIRFEDSGNIRYLYTDTRNEGPGVARRIACVAVAGDDTLARINLGEIGAGENTGYKHPIRIPQSISSLILLLENGGGAPKAYQLILGDPPPPPVSVNIFPEQEGVRITWAKAQGAEAYKIYRAEASGGPYYLVSGVLNETSFWDPLIDDRTWWWRVSSLDGYLNEGDKSGPVAGRRNPEQGPFSPVYEDGIGYPSPQAWDMDPLHPGKEIVVAGLKDYIHLVGADGSSLPGWPKAFPGSNIYATPIIGDVTGEGIPEVVVSLSLADGSYVYAFGVDGSVAEGWPRFTGGARVIALMMGDVDGDGKPEVIAKDERGVIYRFRADSLLDSKYETSASNTLFPSVADLDDDGKAEILDCHYDPYTYNGMLHAFREDWSEMKGFPVQVESVPPVSGGISVADLNPSYPGPEIVLAMGNGNLGTYLAVAPASGGDFLRPMTKVSTACATVSPVIADLDGDDKLEVAIMIRESLVICDNEGVPVLRKLVRKHFEWWPGSGNAVAVDIDEDGDQELVFGSFNGLVHAVDATGNTVPGFPVSLSLNADWAGNAIFSSPLISDIDGDASLNMILPTYARYLYAWDIGAMGEPDWPSVRHDPWNTGYYGFVVPEARALSSNQDTQKPRLALYAPYPNPFRDAVVISYSLPDESAVSLRLYSVDGRRIKEVVNEKEAAGIHTLSLDTRNLPSGVYFLRLEHPRGQFTKKITKIK